MGRFVFTLFAALAAMEREQISERTNDAMLSQQASSRRMSAVPSYGWKRDYEADLRIAKDAGEQGVTDLIVCEWVKGNHNAYKIA